MKVIPHENHTQYFLEALGGINFAVPHLPQSPMKRLKDRIKALERKKRPAMRLPKLKVWPPGTRPTPAEEADRDTLHVTFVSPGELGKAPDDGSK